MKGLTFYLDLEFIKKSGFATDFGWSEIHILDQRVKWVDEIERPDRSRIIYYYEYICKVPVDCHGKIKYEIITIDADDFHEELCIHIYKLKE